MLRYIMKLVGLALLFGLSSNMVEGQDIHFSQYNSSPLYLNPALTGNNGCDFRFALNYKTQWANVANYRTIGGSYDMTLGKKNTYSNYGGVGVMFFTDKAGDSQYSTNIADLTAGYTLLLDRRGEQIISGALQAGIIQRSLNVNNLTFDSQYDIYNGTLDPNRPTQENLNTTKILSGDIGAGFLWSMNTSGNNSSNYYGGLALTHINQPKESFMNDPEEKLFMKLTFHGGGHIALNSQLFLLPSFMILKQGPESEINFGTLIEFKKSIMPTDKTAFYLGGWYRLRDALIISGRVDVGGFNIGLSYDLNISGLTPATKGRGGPELSLIYTDCFNKKNITRFCPFL